MASATCRTRSRSSAPVVTAPETQLRRGHLLTAAELYAIWRIRESVFALEQKIIEPDVDGRDLLPDTHHLWVDDADGIVSYLRSYVDGEGRHIGRVCTRADARSQGHSGRLMTEAHRIWGDSPIVVHAQAHLEDWYAGLGYVRTGDNFSEAGIDHVPMVRGRP